MKTFTLHKQNVVILFPLDEFDNSLAATAWANAYIHCSNFHQLFFSFQFTEVVVYFRFVEICKTGKIGNPKPFSAGISVLISSAQPQRYNETIALGTSQLLVQAVQLSLLMPWSFSRCFLDSTPADDEFEC